MPHYLNPQNIFPKRLGLMNGNTLIVEYYDLTRDKFKRHPIPYDPHSQVKAIIDEIYKNVKHIPYLKKIDPKHMRAVIEGQVIGGRKEAQQPINDRHIFEEFAQAPKRQEERLPERSSYEEFNKESNIISNDSQLSSKSKKQSQGKPSKPEEIDEYYGEEFEDFEVSQSMEKGNKSISISNIEKQKSSVIDGNSSASSSTFSKQKQSKIEPSKSVVEKVIEESIEEEYADDFQFVDEEPAPKKGKKEKEKKQNKEEKEQKKESPPKQAEEQFQFL